LVFQTLIIKLKIDNKVYQHEIGDVDLYKSFFTLIHSCLDVKSMDCVIQMKGLEEGRNKNLVICKADDLAVLTEAWDI
jgi:hypothetical protein